MKKDYVESFLGKNVEITLFDGEVIKGEFHKSREERFKNNPDLFLPNNRYFTIKPKTSLSNSCMFRSSHITKIKECDYDE